MNDKIQTIKRIVAEAHGLKLEDLSGVSRNPPLPLLRHMAMAIAHNLVPMSLPRLAAEFGFKNHNAAAYGIKQVGARCHAMKSPAPFDPLFVARFRALERKCVAALITKVAV